MISYAKGSNVDYSYSTIIESEYSLHAPSHS
jgi:hypothetical protein